MILMFRDCLTGQHMLMHSELTTKSHKATIFLFSLVNSRMRVRRKVRLIFVYVHVIIYSFVSYLDQ